MSHEFKLAIKIYPTFEGHVLCLPPLLCPVQKFERPTPMSE